MMLYRSDDPTSSVKALKESEVVIQTDFSLTRLTSPGLIDWLSMVLRLRQHNIGYTADGFYRSDHPTNSVKALKEGG